MMPAGWRFVQPATRRLELAGGDWILVKERLSAGERNEHYERQYKVTADGALVPAIGMRAGLSMMLAYLVEWSLTDASGRIVPLKGLNGDGLAIATAALGQLDPESYDEMLQAIKRHELEMIAAREAEKKTHAGAPASSATSSLRVVSGGPSSTSGPLTPMSTP